MFDIRDERDRIPDPRRRDGTWHLFAAAFRALGADLAGLARRRRAPSGAVTRPSSDKPAVVSAGRPSEDTIPTPAAPRRRSRLRALAAGVAAVLLLAGGAAAAWVVADLPTEAVIRPPSRAVAILEAADGRRLSAGGDVVGPYTTAADVPAHLVAAVLAIEDRRFRDHHGLDLRGILRAALRNVRAGGVVEGGSTITQQLVKITVLDSDRTWRRKLQEFVLAPYAEGRLGKDEILSRYLNAVYLGAGARGFPAAAEVYFGKDVRDLDVPESALLAGLIRAPSSLSPFTDLPAARARAGVVLSAMTETGALTAAEAEAARRAVDRIEPVRTRKGTWFADWIARDAADLAGEAGAAIEVRTTLDPALQRLGERVVADTLKRRGKAAGASQAALVALRPDGAVLAMVGGRNFQRSTFNRATAAMRQPGSTFKLFVTYAALKAGFTPFDRVRDAPVEIDGWKPQNHSGRYFGRVTIAEAFARSLNAAYVRLAMDVGIGAVADAARELGIDTPLVEAPSLALGTSETTLLDLTGAYASVRAGVAPIEPWGIDTVLDRETGRATRIGPVREATVDLGAAGRDLAGMLALAVERGTGRRARVDRPAAGKTGTSQNYRDAWFVGFTEDLVVGVWVGNDKGEPMKAVTGGALPAEIWRGFVAGASRLGDEPLETGSIVAEGEEPVVDSFDAPRACNVAACSRAYRSFRASDCTYQPWRGSRRICER